MMGYLTDEKNLLAVYDERCSGVGSPASNVSPKTALVLSAAFIVMFTVSIFSI